MTEQMDRSFRDTIATADKKGRRIWIYPTQPKGRFYRARTITSWFLLAFLFGAPFLKISGHPLFLLNVIERRFIIFGMTFWPQDFHLFVLAAITLVVFIVLFTAVFGRLFCGWVCPQTVFLEMVFRKIEYLIEGNAGKQRRLDQAPWTAGKIMKKSAKHVIFFGISFLIGNTFLAWIIGIDSLGKIITDPPEQHLVGLSFMILFSLLFYGVFAWFREQACTLVCPYGRLQSVLLDNNSIVVAYDNRRGEPRGPAARHEDFATRGHCIDCSACVHVCPTGIDIRNGTQLECVNCTGCIDACDNVMRKLNLPPGLIRYASVNSIEHKKAGLFTPRVIGYTIALAVLSTIMMVLLLNRSDIEATILRTPGSLYQETDDGTVRNLYNLSLVNKTYHEMPIRLELKSPEGHIRVVGQPIVVAPDSLAEAVFFVDIEKDHLYSSNSLVNIEIFSGDRLLREVKTNFMGPKIKHGKRDDHDEKE